MAAYALTQAQRRAGAAATKTKNNKKKNENEKKNEKKRKSKNQKKTKKDEKKSKSSSSRCHRRHQDMYDPGPRFPTPPWYGLHLAFRNRISGVLTLSACQFGQLFLFVES